MNEREGAIFQCVHKSAVRGKIRSLAETYKYETGFSKRSKFSQFLRHSEGLGPIVDI